MTKIMEIDTAFERKKFLGRIFYLLALTLFLTISIIGTTTFARFSTIETIIKLICYFLIFTKLVFLDRYSVKEFIFLVFICILGMLVAYKSNNTNLLLIIMFIVGARKLDFREIVLAYFIVGCTITIAAVISSKIGLIENYIYYRGTIQRQSFGIIYPTDFAAHIFYLILAYCFLINRRLKIIEVVVFSFIAFLVNKYCDAHLDVALIILTIFFFYIIMANHCQKVMRNFVKIVSIVLPSFLFGLSVLLCYFYRPMGFIGELDRLLSGRLALGNQALFRYPIKLFGQYFETRGFGGENGNSLAYAIDRSLYFYIDSSYIFMLLRYGILFTFIILLLFAIKNYKTESIVYRLIIILVLGSAFVDQTLLNPAYNIFIFSFFSTINNEIDS